MEALGYMFVVSQPFSLMKYLFIYLVSVVFLGCFFLEGMSYFEISIL